MIEKIRRAEPDDAVSICTIIRKSIEILCTPDHHNNAKILGPWLENKTPEVISGWIAGNPEGYIVYEVDGMIAAVGAYTPQGHILLNYIHPDYRFRGISKKILAAMEQEISKAGLSFATLVSTVTAHDFYISQGYLDTAPPQKNLNGKISIAMEKKIIPTGNK